MEKELICISCPIGCHLKVSWDCETKPEMNDITVENNKCPRGTIYGQEEILSPKRVVTATCAVESIHMGRIPVKTTGAILKGDIAGLLEDIYKINLITPVKTGDIIINNYKKTGINLVVTRSLSE